MIRLISYQQPEIELIEDGILTCSDLVAFCARVSNPDNQYNVETSDKLIQYLIKHKHWSPLEMVHVCLEIVSTRDIVRQLLRHRSFTFQEFSQRYSDPTEALEFEYKEPRFQDEVNRQNSITCTDEALHREWRTRQKWVSQIAESQYKWAISKGLAKECARVVLPEGLMRSRIYVNGSLRSWIHYCELRTGDETQREHRLVAKECAAVISNIFPQMELISGKTNS